MATSKKVAVKKTPVKKTPQKKSANSKKALTATAAAAPGVNGKVTKVTVRMYAHGFGDCFLLFFYSGPNVVYKMVIDCGMLTGDNGRLKDAIRNIAKDCNNEIDVVVQTHQHKDHISGFNLRDTDEELLWDKINVREAWLAWTENTGKGGDELARQLQKKHEKKKMALIHAVALYKQHVKSQRHIDTLKEIYTGGIYHSAQERYVDALQELLEFDDIGRSEIDRASDLAETGFGLTMKEAMAYFLDRNDRIKNSKIDKETTEISYWEPGEFADEAATGLPGINFYFMGPPKNYDRLKQMDDKTHTEMYVTDMGLSDNFYMALEGSEDGDAAVSPFHPKFSCDKSHFTAAQLANKDNVWNLYNDKEHYWRDIDTDWLNNAGALALALDSYTNNTSLVMAIEFTESKKVLLFVADAQIGNWISWTEPVNEQSTEPKLKWIVKEGTDLREVKAIDLLQRTVFYKVGHHASHNATGRKNGLELMNSGELVAMIPVDESVAKKQGKKGWKMPAKDLYTRLMEKTKGRIIRVDEGNLIKNDTSRIPDIAKPTEKQRTDFNTQVTESNILVTGDDGTRRPLYWEYKINGK
jgi:hypothetical protein